MSRQSDKALAYEANNPHCHNGCGTRVYWRDGRYCQSCRIYPERYCFECGQVSQTLGAECLNCDKPLGRLQFGFDRLSDNVEYGRVRDAQRVGGWGGATVHPDAVWTEVAPTTMIGGEMVATQLRKPKAPGIGWPRDNSGPRPGTGGPSTGWLKAAIAEVNWYSCAACGGRFGPGDGDNLRSTIVGTLDFSTTAGPKAHKACPLTPYENDALAASHLASGLAVVARADDRNAGRQIRTGRWGDYLTWADPEQAPEAAEAAA